MRYPDRLLRSACAFFYMRDALTFMGIAKALAAPLGLLIAGLSVNFLSSPADVEVDIQSTFVCADLRQFEHHFDRTGISIPVSIQQSLGEVIHRHKDGATIMVQCGEEWTWFRLNPLEQGHHILCWWNLPFEELESVGEPKADCSGLPDISDDSGMLYSLWEELSAVTWEPESPRNLASPRSPVAALLALSDLETSKDKLSYRSALRPSSQAHPDWDTSAWPSAVALVDVFHTDVSAAIVDSDASVKERRFALEVLRESRWVFSVVKIKNASKHAVAQNTKITIRRRNKGFTEALDATFDVRRLGQDYVGTIDVLLPGESEHVILRTRIGQVSPEEVRIARDPATFMDSNALRKMLPWLGFLMLVFIASNILARVRYPELRNEKQ